MPARAREEELWKERVGRGWVASGRRHNVLIALLLTFIYLFVGTYPVAQRSGYSVSELLYSSSRPIGRA